MSSSIVAADPLVHVAFNRDGTHLVAATSSGVRVFSCSFASPDGSGAAGEVTSADLGVLEPEPLVAVVFGDTMRYWSEAHGQMMSADMSPSPHVLGAVRAVRHVGDHVVVAGKDRVTLHEISRDGGGGVRLVMEVDTGPNPLGACALAQADGGGQGFVLACPSPTSGEVQVWQRGRSDPVDVRVHRCRSVACLELSGDGQLLAAADSASAGTGLVHIFSTTDGLTRQHLILGGVRTVVHCMAFSRDSKWLAVSGDKPAAVDVFAVEVDLTPWTPPEPSDDDPSHLSPRTRAFLEACFRARCSVAKFCLDEGISYHRVTFGQEPNTVFIIDTDGNFYRCQFDRMKRNMKQIERRNVMDMT